MIERNGGSHWYEVQWTATLIDCLIKEQLAEVHSTVNKYHFPYIITNCLYYTLATFPVLIPSPHSQTHFQSSFPVLIPRPLPPPVFNRFQYPIPIGGLPPSPLPPCLPSVFPLCVVYPCFNTHDKISQPFSFSFCIWKHLNNGTVNGWE